ncbi:MAG TPA: helix-turn-helix domain-containing protein [Nitratidesulfovibrio sp.]|nr:helix-turn-helix domain-containing protein [Nitratidesulfovibrio sp.]
MNAIAKPALLDERQAAEVLGFTISTLRSRRYWKRPPKFVKMGRAVRYRREDLESYIQSCVVQPREG